MGNPWPSLTLGTSPGARSVTAPGDGPHRFHRRRRPRCCIASPGAAANQLVADIPAGQMWAAPLVNAQRTRRPNTAFSTTPARDRSPAAFTNDGLWTRKPMPPWSLHRGNQRATLRTETPPPGAPHSSHQWFVILAPGNFHPSGLGVVLQPPLQHEVNGVTGLKVRAKDPGGSGMALANASSMCSKG